MSYVFKNKGVIDPRSITTFGVSSKEKESPIGFFGTGLKYAIAVLLRLKCEIAIHSGGVTYEFHTITSKLRVDEFDFVHMDVIQKDGETALDQALGFTTELGKQWEIWQAFRELACNTIDENGEYYEHLASFGPVLWKDEETWVVVNGIPFSYPWSERDSILLKTPPLVTSSDVAIHAGKSQWIYYRGVRVHKTSKESIFTYNILEAMDLTEDRTFKNQFMADSRIEAAWRYCKDKALIKKALFAVEESLEGRIFYSGYVSPEFTEVVMEGLKSMSRGLNEHAINAVKRGNLKAFITDDTKKLSKLDKNRLEKAVKFAKDIGFEVDKYPIIVSDNLGVDVLGQALDGTIYVSIMAFRQGTKIVAGTIIEEYLHLKHGIIDNSCGMQNFLIDTICSLGEQITGEPL